MAISNEEALDKYALGWSSGDVEMILSVLDKACVITGFTESEINCDNFADNYKKFVAEVEAQGEVSMTPKNMIRKNVGDTMVESANVVIPGVLNAVYMVAAKEGKVIWEHLAMDS